MTNTPTPPPPGSLIIAPTSELREGPVVLLIQPDPSAGTIGNTPEQVATFASDHLALQYCRAEFLDRPIYRLPPGDAPDPDSQPAWL